MTHKSREKQHTKPTTEQINVEPTEHNLSTRSTEIISEEVFDWIKKQELHEEILQGYQITLEQSFSINELKEKPGYFEFKCRICHSKLFLTRKPSGLTVVTNIHRHLKDSCWLKKEKVCYIHKE